MAASSVLKTLVKFCNPEYEDINSSTFKHSQLDMRMQDKRILKSQVDGILTTMNAEGQKNLQILDKTLEQHIGGDVKALERENELLNKELNELNYYK